MTAGKNLVFLNAHLITSTPIVIIIQMIENGNLITISDDELLETVSTTQVVPDPVYPVGHGFTQLEE